MDFTTLFIRRPVMTTLVMVAILVFGIVAYRKLRWGGKSGLLLEAAA